MRSLGLEFKLDPFYVLNLLFSICPNMTSIVLGILGDFM